MSSSTSEPRRVRRAYIWIVAIVVVLFAILTGFWFFAASQLEQVTSRAIDDAERNGVIVSCPGRDVVGYPFRIGLVCDDLAIEVPRNGVAVDAGSFRSAAQIYQPNLVVSELDAPVRIETADGPPVDLSWELAQASTSFWTEGLDRISVATDAPRIAIGGQAVFNASAGEVHARRREGDLDIAGNQRSAKIEVPQLSNIPNFDLSTDLTVQGAADWLSGGASGRTARELFAGRSGTLRSLNLQFHGDPAGADLSGDFAFSQEGLLSGTFDLAVTSPERLASIVGSIAPEAASIANTVASVIPYVGKTENGRTTIRVTADDGQLTAGVIPLGEIPPLE
ncbi:DUF2125 domain-containing protein [Fulvimarina sp. MAC8]|uniref:DUF2125 domain-containing protein n=1 Tax=Fulvimarina sp. MAC8 TaxID=3162874 RepID=UPI0032EBB324